MSKKIGELVSFQNEYFFEGAVQLKWTQDRESQARLAASSFVFHGPRYHGAGNAENDGIEGGYRLKDSASFVSNLIDSIHSGLRGEDVNPYWLVVAGYGSGKSHLALTCATLLSDPHGDIAQKIIANISNADEEIGNKVRQDVARFTRPVLVLSLDGMAGFHLGNALSQAVFKQLDHYDVDAGAIRALSPRFQMAEQFVERNFEYRIKRFSSQIPGLSSDDICARLRNNDEQIYSKVDGLYSEANGSPIPLVGQESAQDLINTLSEVYCGNDGDFSGVLILFDEFGRYLEYAAEKPHLAGDSALQQIFQGVQDNSVKVRFVGLIQYELKAYLKRFGSADLRQLQRYITRFDSAQKWYLSTNLETIFAHMIGKKQPALEQAWIEANAETGWKRSWQKMRSCLPGYERLPVWNDDERFNRVIAEGCWPLHPLATWFLTRQRDVVQSRSALTFIKEMIERITSDSAVTNGRLRQVSVSELVLSSMLPELISAERETGSAVAETLQLLLEKFQTHLNEDQGLVLAGVAILEKMRVGKQSQEMMDQLLCEATSLTENVLAQALHALSHELGAIEWNRDLGQYELIADATTRGQFQQWLRKHEAKFNSDAIRELFVRRGPSDTGFGNVATDFGAMNEISTPEWNFEAQFSHSKIVEQSIRRAFDEWVNAITPTDAKGKIIYLYLHPDDDAVMIENKVETLMRAQLLRLDFIVAPIWVAAIVDRQGVMAEHIGRVCLFDEQISAEDRDRFQRFVPSERSRSINALQESAQNALKERKFWISGFATPPEGRLKKVAEEVFLFVYPKVVPFPFDGFGTAAGGGALDCAQLTRSLITRQVDGDWVQAQPKRLQNRVGVSLVSSWKALPSNGVLTSPAGVKVKPAYEWLKKSHLDNPNKTLWASYKGLIAPPFGMNGASAGLLIGLFLGDGSPPRRIERNGLMVASGEWVNEAYPAQKGRHFLDKLILEKSTLRFLSEDSEGRWRNILKRWELEKNHQIICDISHEVERMQRIEPRSEKFDGLYLHLKERSEKSVFELVEFKGKLEGCETALERAASNGNVGEFLRIGTQLFHMKSKMDLDECWPDSCIQNCDQQLKMIRELLTPLLQNWIARQGCSTAMQVADFRYQMNRAAESMRLLGFESQSRLLDQQSQSSIAQIEARQKFSLTLDQSNDYPRQPDPTDSTKIREMRDAISEGADLISGLQAAESVLKSQEIAARIDAIMSRQKRLKDGIDKHKNALGALFEYLPRSEDALRDVMINALRLREIFVGTKDQSEVSEIVVQLERILSDVATWESIDVSVERLEELLQQRIKAQLLEMESFLSEKDIDPAWNFSEIYITLKNDRITTARKRSEDWLASRLIDEDQISMLNKMRTISLESELIAAPIYLTEIDRVKVEQFLTTVQNRRALLEENERRERVAIWQKSFLDLGDLQLLSKHETERNLRELHNPPEEVLPIEQAKLQLVAINLTTHLDKLGIDELIDRIGRLSLDAQHKLLTIISERLA